MENQMNRLETEACQIQATFAPKDLVSKKLRRLFFDAVRRGTRMVRGIKNGVSPSKERVVDSGNGTVHEFQEGEWVRVKSLEEIRPTLDETGRTGGCKFTKPMVRYCGKEFRVARKMDRFFDEAQWKMVRCKKLVLLEGSYCDGSGGWFTEGCARMCFVFWREEWLKKTD
jgi:hypothetical protein